ncbi:MAG: nucleotidyl transferase AbiEii/AbiGii toxin family protein [Melioribacteraceae bacterium]
MEIDLFYNILDSKSKYILENLKEFKKHFYLAGGTGLALLMGHRKSDDFDFFTHKEFNEINIHKFINENFHSNVINYLQNEKDTITVLINDKIKLSFFSLSYQNYLPLIETKYFNLADEREIGVMKLISLLRAAYRDYVDLYFILKKYPLAEIISLAQKKHPEIDIEIYLKSLVSFDDIEIMPLKFTKGNKVSHKQVFNYIKKCTEEFLISHK